MAAGFPTQAGHALLVQPSGSPSATEGLESLFELGPILQDSVTDPERFWDHYQAKTLPAIHDYMMELTEGQPRRQDAPHFGELRFDLTASEPDYQVGVDKEQISPLESVMEELYFGTLHFFDLLGRFTVGEPLDYPGRVIPVMRPKADGGPGQARISFTGFRLSRPGILIEYRERGGREGRARLDIPKVNLERPRALAARVVEGKEGIERLDLWVKVHSGQDRRSELLLRAWQGEAWMDQEIMSAEQAKAVLENLVQLRRAGPYRDALAYHDLRSLRVTVAWEYEPSEASQMVVELEPNGTPAPFPDINEYLPSGYRYTGGEMVQWDTPIPPAEAYEILAKISTFEEAASYKVGESYLGKDVWAMDLMPPIQASHWSQAKATALKPTVIYSARQDANEVSSTSHVLKLAELLLTDPGYREKLNKVNVVVQPITNADGAQLAYDLYKITPNFMLHPGYLGPLGVTVIEVWEPDSIYPESRVRPKLWRMWLPDIFLNPHGMPDHEWVQMFSEYSPWIRTRTRSPATNWSPRAFFWPMRGWWLPGFHYLDDPRYPRHKEAAFKLRQRIADYMNAVPEVRALNERGYDRYRRYGVEFDPGSFKADLVDGVLIYTALKGLKADPQAEGGLYQRMMQRYPNITIWAGATESPDETAQGDWLKLVATAGLQWDKANLDYLVNGNHRVERRNSEFFGGVSLSFHRPRPPKEP